MKLTPEVQARIAALQPLERFEQDRDRYRRLPGGEWWPSSTTILGGTLYQGWAKNWAAKVERGLVIEAAADAYLATPDRKLSRTLFSVLVEKNAGKPYAHERVAKAAADIGTEAHEMIKWVIRKQLGDTFTPEPQISEPAQVSVANWERWRSEHSMVPLAAEIEVYHEGEGYTGGADWLGMTADSDELVINDWKSGAQIDLQHHLQLASYIVAAQEMGIPVTRGWIVRIPRNLSDPGFKAVEVGHVAAGRVYSIEELFNTFLHVKAVWDFTHHTNKPAMTGRTAGAAARAGTPTLAVVKDWKREALERFERAGICDPVRIHEKCGELIGRVNPLGDDEWKLVAERFEQQQIESTAALSRSLKK